MNRLLPLALLAAVGCRGDGRSAPAPGDPAVRGAEPTVAAGRRVAQPVTPALLDRLAPLAVPGATVTVLARGARDLAWSITAADGTRATATASACLGCVALDLAAWRERRAALAALWAPGAEAQPPGNDATLAIESLALGGAEHAIVIDARRSGGAALTIAHWNDGALQLEAICEQPAAACTPLVQAALTAAIGALP